MATRKNTAPEAQSLSSIVVQAQALAATVEKLQADIRVALDSQRPEPQEPAAPAAEARPATDAESYMAAIAELDAEGPARPLDAEARNSILEYLVELVPIADVIYGDKVEETMARGRAAVRRLVNGSVERLPFADCADVLALLSHSEPRRQIPIDSNEQCGFINLMDALQASVRGAGGQPADQPDGGIDWEKCGAKGSITHMLSERPGGIEGAWERIKAAEAAGVEKWAALRQELGVDEPAEARASSPAAVEPPSQSADSVPAIPVSLFQDDQHERLMQAAAIVATVSKALGEGERPEEFDALRVAVSMLHKIDDELDTACYRAIEAWDLAHPDHPVAIERRRVLDGIAEEVAS